MTGKNVKNEAAIRAGYNMRRALRVPTATAKIALGAFLTLSLTPDMVYVATLTLESMRGPDGTVTSYAIGLAWLTGFVVMVALAWILHEWWSRWAINATTGFYLFLAVLALLVITAQPMVTFLKENNLAGTGIDSFGEKSAGQALALGAVLARVLAFPLCAIVGSIGIGLISAGVKERRVARDAGKASSSEIMVTNKIHEAEVKADKAAAMLKRQKDKMGLEFRKFLHRGANSLACQYESYVTGRSPAPSRATLHEELSGIMSASLNPKDSFLMDLVEENLPAIVPIENLPEDGSTLPHLAREELISYARYIKRQYSKRSLKAAF